MKNNKFVKILASTLAVAAALGITVAAAYDSSEDPLITWSYLRDIFKPEILDAVDEKVDERFEEYDILLENKKDETEEIPEETEPEETTPPAAVSSTYEVLELKMGDAVYAVSACDIMLRSGTVNCIAPDATQGIADYTSAEEIYNGMPLTKNHMCLIPRGDGRGVIATSETVFIMVRGDYTIVEN